MTVLRKTYHLLIYFLSVNFIISPYAVCKLRDSLEYYLHRLPFSPLDVPYQEISSGVRSGDFADQTVELKKLIKKFLPPPMPPHVLFVDFVVLPPRHGRSVTDF